MASLEWEHVAVAVSWALGWIYFLAWTISFFPQPWLNFQRRTTTGLMPDFPLLNVFGFSCYTSSTALLLFSRVIRDQYASRHPLSPEPTVRANDLAFGIVGLAMSIVTYSQFWPRVWRWQENPCAQRRATSVTLGLIWGSLLSLIIVTAVVSSRIDSSDATTWCWIDLVYAAEYIKLLMTVFKYIPQVIANFRRRSTIGWSIAQQLLDFTGGLGSLLQLIIDSGLQQDWSGLTGNPLKLGLANISLLFDIVFIVQHFVLFGPVEEHSDSSVQSTAERGPLLAGA